MAFLSQASHLGSLLLPHDAFQEHAAHRAEWSAQLSSKGSERTCIRSGLPTFLYCAFTAHSDLVVTRRASTGMGNLTLDFLYLSDGRPCNSSENRVNNINMLEIYHEIRGNLEKLTEWTLSDPRGASSVGGKRLTVRQLRQRGGLRSSHPLRALLVKARRHRQSVSLRLGVVDPERGLFMREYPVAALHRLLRPGRFA